VTHRPSCCCTGLAASGSGDAAGAPAQPQFSFPEPIPGLQPPAKIFAAAVAAGQAKANLPAAKILAMGVLAGAYLALGGAAAFAVAGACPGEPLLQPLLQQPHAAAPAACTACLAAWIQARVCPPAAEAPACLSHAVAPLPGHP
jgi:hypothetical protein